MRQLAIKYIVGFGALTLALLGSCKQEVIQSCDMVACAAGNCVDGRCKCDSGYTGKQCETETRAKFIGTFSGHEACSITGPFDYEIFIERNDTDISAVNFRNVWNAGEYIYSTGNLGSDGNIYIPRQRIYGYYTWITGKAVLLNGKLKVSYSIEDGMFGSETDNCVWLQN